MIAALLDGLAPHSGWNEGLLFAGKDVLHFAPEKQLRDRVGGSARRYVTADLDRDDCDLRLDMSSMQSVQDNAFDVIIACDVLEHVPDDRAAMRELHRVLRPGGKALLTVPQKDPPSVTDEDPSVLSEDARTRRFGQKDHVRIYGDDFCQRLQEVGFTVHTLTSAQFPAAATKRHVLTPPALNSDALATNVRRLYLAEAN
jgi:SAM-dependent methyltransferase